MKLALIHDWLTGMRGGEKCLEAVARQFPDATLYSLLHRPGSTSLDIERLKIKTSFLQRVPGIHRWYRYFLPLMPRAIESLKISSDVDAVLSFSHCVAKSVRVPSDVPHICYCFTPMRYAWHLRNDYFAASSGRTSSNRISSNRSATISATNAGQMPLSDRLKQAAAHPLHWARNRLLENIRQWDRRTSSRVTHYIAISHTIRERILECYDRDSTVIYPPVDTRFYTPANVAREDFYLCVSALVPYKRIDLAIETCNKLGRRLIVIGDGPCRKKLEQLAGPDVRLLGWRSNEEIRDHLRRCRALLFPGHEDFGIVPVEAQACGAPVLAFDRGGATETVIPATPRQLGTGILFPAQSVDALAGAIETCERHSDRISARLARHNALAFDGERFEEQIISFVKHAVTGEPMELEVPAPLRRAA